MRNPRPKLIDVLADAVKELFERDASAFALADLERRVVTLEKLIVEGPAVKKDKD